MAMRFKMVCFSEEQATRIIEHCSMNDTFTTQIMAKQNIAGMGWKSKEVIEGGAMLLGAIGIIALFVGFMLTPDYATAHARDLFWGTSLSIIGSVVMGSGIVTFVIARLRASPA